MSRLSPEGAKAVADSNRRRAIYKPDELMPGILRRIEAGETLRQICRDPNMPSHGNVIEWASREEWTDQYARAQERRLLSMGDEILEIADDSRNDWIERETRAGRIIRVVDQEALGRSKLRIDARQWLLSRLLPGVFGDRIQVDARVLDLVAYADMGEAARKAAAALEDDDDRPALPAVIVPDGADMAPTGEGDEGE